jgi:hypothetical protein
MNSALYIGGFLIVWGVFYWLFAFVGRESRLAQSFFKVPAIFVFLPSSMMMTVGRVMTGALCMGAGAYLIYYLSQFAA